MKLLPMKPQPPVTTKVGIAVLSTSHSHKALCENKCRLSLRDRARVPVQSYAGASASRSPRASLADRIGCSPSGSGQATPTSGSPQNSVRSACGE